MYVMYALIWIHSYIQLILSSATFLSYFLFFSPSSRWLRSLAGMPSACIYRSILLLLIIIESWSYKLLHTTSFKMPNRTYVFWIAYVLGAIPKLIIYIIIFLQHVFCSWKCYNKIHFKSMKRCMFFPCAVSMLLLHFTYNMC